MISLGEKKIYNFTTLFERFRELNRGKEQSNNSGKSFKKQMLDRLRLSGPNGLFFTSGKNEAKRVTDC